MSDLTPNYENAYGIKHNWVNVFTHQWGRLGGKAKSYWRCAGCAEQFIHFYHDEPDIHKAMKDANVSEECPPVREKLIEQEDDGA